MVGWTRKVLFSKEKLVSSLATSPLTTVAVLKAADRMLGRNRMWMPTSEIQQAWLEHTYGPGVLDLARVPEIEVNATRDIANHIAFLEKHGWKAQITDPLAGGAIATAAVLDVLVEWPRLGKSTPIRIPGGEHFAGFELKCEDNIVVHGHRSWVGHVIMLGTKSQDIVYIMETERPPVSVLDLMEITDRMIDPNEHTRAYASHVVIPMVDLASKQSLDWLPGIHTIGDDGMPAVIAQAIQQATLKMNETGARARAADEMRVTRGMTPRENKLIIDKPFLFAITRRGVTKPIFCAYVDRDSWKDPGSLGQ